MTSDIIIVGLGLFFAVWFLVILWVIINHSPSKIKSKDESPHIFLNASSGKNEGGSQNALLSVAEIMGGQSNDYYADSFFCTIAGARYHCKKKDIGGFIGWVEADPFNEHDPKACAIYRKGGYLMGYIPKDELDDYRAWSGCQKRYCIGFIKQGDSDIFGKVKVLHPDDNVSEEQGKAFLDWVADNLGVKYIPPEYQHYFSE